MTCPTCGSALSPGHGRCSSCGEGVAPPIEGALAADPRRVTPPARGRVADTLREIPGMRRRESTWKDEVRERVRNRREQRSASPALPLFPEAGDLPTPPDSAVSLPDPPASLLPDRVPAGSGPGNNEQARPFDQDSLLTARYGGPEELGDDAADLLLRPEGNIEAHIEGHIEGIEGNIEPHLEMPIERRIERHIEKLVERHGPEPATPASLRDDPVPDAWSLSGAPEPVDVPEAADRPATLGERFQAGAIDAGLLVPLVAVVVYFASRAARVPMMGLLPAWPPLAGYLAFLGLAYAGYFTGTTGQTLGKIVIGLRVVDAGGQPPGYFRAFVRAALGAVGVLAAALGFVSALFDPARRALHDRLLGTRVVKN